MSLSKRLDRIMAQEENEGIDQFRLLSLDEMLATKVTFGRVHVGKTYGEVWDREKGWVRWFSKTYGDSKKVEHMKMLTFIERMVDSHEATHNLPVMDETQQGVILPRCKAQPKSKSMAAPAQECPVHEIPVDVMEEFMEDPWDVTDRPAMLTSQAEHINALESRVAGMENALTEILGHLRSSN